MKKFLFALVVVCSFATVKSNAQIQKGNVLVGGDLANFNLGLDKSSEFKMTLTPKAAWFIADNVAVGGMVNLGLDALQGHTSTTYGIDALARYYLGPNAANTDAVLKHTRIFAEGYVGLNGSNISGGATTNGLGLGFGPGLTYFITPSVGLEGLLEYQGIIGGGNNTINNKLNLSVGFQIYLPGRSTAKKVMNDTK